MTSSLAGIVCDSFVHDAYTRMHFWSKVRSRASEVNIFTRQTQLSELSRRLLWVN